MRDCQPQTANYNKTLQFAIPAKNKGERGIELPQEDP